MLMSEWQIHIEGGNDEIRILDILLSKDQFTIDKLARRNLLTLPDVAPEAGIEAIKAAADRLVEVVNGAARLLYPKFKAVSYTSVTRLKQDGTREGVDYLTAQVGPTVSTALIPGDRTLSDWIEIGLGDDDVARAFYLYGSLEPGWKNLYMVIEVIEDDLGGENALLNSGLPSVADIKRLKQTANSYRALGREARHATLVTDPPKSPMTLEQANTVVRNLMRAWLLSKRAQSA
jgi:hypothetical protein